MHKQPSRERSDHMIVYRPDVVRSNISRADTNADSNAEEFLIVWARYGQTSIATPKKILSIVDVDAKISSWASPRYLREQDGSRLFRSRLLESMSLPHREHVLAYLSA